MFVCQSSAQWTGHVTLDPVPQNIGSVLSIHPFDSLQKKFVKLPQTPIRHNISSVFLQEKNNARVSQGIQPRNISLASRGLKPTDSMWLSSSEPFMAGEPSQSSFPGNLEGKDGVLVLGNSSRFFTGLGGRWRDAAAAVCRPGRPRWLSEIQNPRMESQTTH